MAKFSSPMPVLGKQCHPDKQCQGPISPILFLMPLPKTFGGFPKVSASEAMSYERSWKKYWQNIVIVKYWQSELCENPATTDRLLIHGGR
jgi:hypothetical protein